MREAPLEALEPSKRPVGRPRKRPAQLHADKAYDAAEKRQALRRRGLPPHGPARRGVVREIGSGSVGGRTDTRLGQPRPALADSLGAAGG
jgi:hypothetical protein